MQSVLGMISKAGISLAPERKTQHDMALKAMSVLLESQIRTRGFRPKFELMDLGWKHKVKGHRQRRPDGTFFHVTREIATLYAAPVHYQGAGARARRLAA